MRKNWSGMILKLYQGLLFLLPLVWLPITSELFEFNKMVLVYCSAVVIGAVWLGRMVVEKRVIFQKSFLFWPLILFFFSQLAATVFSIDPHTSLFGYYSRFHGGLLSLLAYLVLYFALVSNGQSSWPGKIVKGVLISGVLVAGWGVAEHFGIDKKYWVQDVQNRVFSTLGQPNWLAAYLNVILFLVLGEIFFRKDSTRLSLRDYFLVSLFYLCLLYTKSRSGLIGFGSGLLFLLFLWGRHSAEEKGAAKKILSLLLFLAGVSFLVGTPFSPSLKKVFFSRSEKSAEATPSAELNITPSGEIRQIVWRGALELWRRYPLLGTGVESFAYAYYWVRPVEHNLTSEWDFLYNKAHNEYLNLAANSGTLGLVTYLLIPLFYFFWLRKEVFSKKEREKGLMAGMGAAMISLLVTNFFGFSVVVTGLWFFLLPGLSFLLTQPDRKEEKGEIRGKKDFFLLLMIALVALGFVFQIGRYWWADVLFARGKNLAAGGQFKASYHQLKKAIELNPREANFYSQYALTLANLAVLSDQGGLATQSAQMAQEAIEASDRALSLNPYHLNLYKERAQVFYTLSKINLDYLKDSLATLLAAIKLAPTDAKLYYNAGLMFHALGEKEEGERYLKKALQLKPNYDRARFWLEKFFSGDD